MTSICFFPNCAMLFGLRQVTKLSTIWTSTNATHHHEGDGNGKQGKQEEGCRGPKKLLPNNLIDPILL